MPISNGSNYGANRLMQTNLVFANAYAAPFLAIDRGQWIPARSSFIYCPLPPTASTAVLVQAEGACTVGDGDPNCRAYVSIRPFISGGIGGNLSCGICTRRFAARAQIQTPARARAVQYRGVGHADDGDHLSRAVRGFEPTQSRAELKWLVWHTRFRLSQRAVGDDCGSKPVLETGRSPTG